MLKEALGEGGTGAAEEEGGNGRGEDGSSELKARLKSLTLPHSDDWLNVVPCTAPGLHLHPQEFVIMARYRYGCPSCRHDTDVQGNHAIYCTSGGCNGDV